MTVASKREILGHPRALSYLAAAEFGIGFSFYGMQSLLALYLVDDLLRPGHAGYVLGMATLERVLSVLYGTVSGQPLASAIIATYAALVYAMPVVGGVVADRWFGHTRTVVVGTVLMTIGHFLMAFEATFLIALGCIIIGSGCAGGLRGQVGALYRLDDVRRPDAFQIYMVALSVSVILAPLVCGTLGERIAWHFGFGAAGIGMLLGMIVYLRGISLYRDAAPAKTLRAPSLGPAGWRVVLVLLALLPVLALANVGNVQIYNAYLVWAQEHYDLRLFGVAAPVSWLLSFDALLSAAATAASVWAWNRIVRRRVSEVTRMALGTLIAAAAAAVLALGAAQPGKLGLLWALAFHGLNAIGFVNVYGIGMALYSRTAPPGLNTTMVNVYLLHLVLASLLAGRLAMLLPVLSGPAFWLLHAGLIGAGGIILLLARIALPGILASPPQAEIEPLEEVPV